ncbi:MAG: tRNA 4-thiouridine(8) synthase ThiI [Chitinivibrionia bacterium]|nr:tRNA 4-thiouridine(8) synthase ThiI [Chitinivibrionia bacterium]
MKYDIIYASFGEVFLKGKNKMAFVKRIVKTFAKKTADLQISYSYTDDNILIELNDCDWQKVAEKLDKIFGIYSYSLGKICKSEIDEICKTALEIVREEASENEKIKFETKRGWKQFPIKSPDVSRLVAEFVSEKFNANYGISNPDKIVTITIKPHFTVVSAKKIIASGGLPIGVGGRALLMLSGGIDSPVAGYLLMKRGLLIDCVHFESPPHTSIKAKQKVFDIAQNLSLFLPEGRINIYFVPFTKLQKEIFANVPQNYAMTVMRRMMLRICDKIARKHEISLIATGESIGQVASQTPKSINTINAVSNMPIIRPLACMDKNEIINIAKKIGTFDISIRPFEDCCTLFVPPNPATMPNIEKAEKFENSWNWQNLVDECVENTQKIIVFEGKPIILDDETTKEICKLFE